MRYAIAAVMGTVASASAQQSYSTIFEYYSDCASTTTGPVSTASGTLTYSLPTGFIYNPSNATGIATDVVTVCPTCTAEPSIYAAGKSVELTTYETVYSCPGPSGLEAKTYTITEPCPSPGVPFPPGYIPQGFTTTTVACTACPGSPNVLITTPVAQKTAAPGTPGGGSSSPGAPGGGSSPPGSPGGGSSSPGAPGGGSSPPGAPGGGALSPGGGSSSPGGGSSSPGSGSSPGGGSAPGGGNAAPPFPIPGQSQGRVGSAPSGSASSQSSSVSSVTPFKGAATKIVTISLSFALSVAGFVGFYFI